MILTSENEPIENGEWFDIDISKKSTKTTNEDSYNITQEILINLSNTNTTLNNKLELNINKNGLKTIKNLNILENSLAFDHISLIYHALERLKNKLEYTDIIFNLLPTNFTLTELKQSYEVILNEKLLDANFRRKIKSKVKPVDDFYKDKGHRPSRLFTHNISWELNNLE